jgi:hypothetical protein
MKCATRKHEYTHFRPEGAYTGSKPVSGVFCGDRGATVETREKFRVAAPKLLLQGNILV